PGRPALPGPERPAVDRDHRAAGGVEGRGEVGDLEQRGIGAVARLPGAPGCDAPLGTADDEPAHRFASFTSMLRRSVSPTKLSDSTVRNMAADGTSAVWGAELRWRLLSEIIPPQVGSGGSTLRPSRASEPSSTMTTPIATRPNAATEGITLGTISRSRIRPRRAPSVWAAWTNSRC